MAKYLIDIVTTYSVSGWYEADSEAEAIEEAKIEFENMDDFGNIQDVEFKVLEKHDEQQ